MSTTGDPIRPTETAPAFVVHGYDVLRLLGTGGMGVVWLARRRTDGMLHAIKLLKEERGRHEERLRTEGRLQATLLHPNVVRVTETIEVRGRPALVMDYVDGPTLEDLLGTDHRLSIPEVDALARGLLAGVSAAHERGWVHRDLKPTNVLLQVNGEGLVPKVADFGIAKVLEEGAGAGTTTRQGMGTARYMCFEQLTGGQPELGWDVFSLGAMLYEMLEGKHAFGPSGAWEQSVRTGQYPQLAREDAPERMRVAVRRSLASHAERVRDARELLALWEAGTGPDPRPFRPETLNACGRGDEHLPAGRLASGTLTSEEEAHLGGCARCRVALRQARAVSEAPDTVTFASATGLGQASAAPAAPATRWVPWVGGAAGALAVGAFGAGLALWVAEPRGGTVPVDPPPPVVRPELEPQPPIVPPPEAADAAEAQPAPAPRRERPAPAPVTGTFEVVGDARDVVLVGPDGRTWSQGAAVAPGRYEAKATFQRHGEVRVEPVWIEAGRTTVLECTDGFARCKDVGHR